MISPRPRVCVHGSPPLPKRPARWLRCDSTHLGPQSRDGLRQPRGPGSRRGGRAHVLPSVLRRSASAESSSDGGVRSGSRCCGISWPESKDGTRCPPRPPPPAPSLPPGGGHPRAPLPWPRGHAGLILEARAASSSPCPWRQLQISLGESEGARGRGLPPSPRKRSPGTGLQLRGRRGNSPERTPCLRRGSGRASRSAPVTRAGHVCWQRCRVARALSGPGHALQPCEQEVWTKTLSPPRGALVVTSRLSVGSQRWGHPARGGG